MKLVLFLLWMFLASSLSYIHSTLKKLSTDDTILLPEQQASVPEIQIEVEQNIQQNQHEDSQQEDRQGEKEEILSALSPAVPDYIKTPEFQQDIQMANYAHKIYSACPSKDYCMEDVEKIRVDVHPVDNNCYVIFRGTDNGKNFVTDISAEQVKNPMGPGRLHSGFASAANAITSHPIYKAGIDHCLSQGASFYFTGHSLGGAVATIAIYYFHVENKSKGLKYRFATFGSPRVGDAAFRDDFVAPSQLGGRGSRYEAVKSDEVSGVFFKTHTSPPGDGAKPGDYVPRVPPITPIVFKTMEMAAWAAKFEDPAFWATEQAAAWLGTSAAADGEGFRHVGKRYQITCDKAFYSCHSMKDVYLARVQAGEIRDV